jgi:hypothetical protein
VNSEPLTCLVNSVNCVEKVTQDFGVQFAQSQFFLFELCENNGKSNLMLC